MADLVTLANLKDYLGETSDTKDVLLARVIAAASSFVERYCQRTFGSTAYADEMYDGTGSDVLVLRNFPIITMTTVKEYGATLTTTEDPASSPSAQVLVYKAEGKLVKPFSIWFPYRRWYAITYTAGYPTLPPVIVQAAIEVAAIMLRKKDHVDLQSKSSGQDTTTYLNGLSGDTKAGMDLYRDLVLGRAA